MQRQIGHAKLQLSQHDCRRAICLRLSQFLKQFLRQGFAGFVVNRHLHQRRPMQTPVLHELARQFDGIPLHATDSCRITEIHGRQHVLQSVSELVEQRLDFPKRHQRRNIIRRRRAVANQMSDRQPYSLRSHRTCNAICHPRSAAFVFWSGIRVQIESRNRSL